MVQSAGLEIPPHYQQRVDLAVRNGTEAIGEEAFAAARAMGRTNIQAVIDEATSASGAPDTANAPATTGRSDRSGLSPRQREVLALLVAGHSDKQIA